MKNLRLQAAALVLFVTAGLASCSNDDAPSIVTKKSVVSLVTGPNTSKVNEEITLEVTYSVESNCGVFNKYIETSTDKTKTIEVETKLEGTTCDTTPANKKTTYKFKAAAVGTGYANKTCSIS